MIIIVRNVNSSIHTCRFISQQDLETLKKINVLGNERGIVRPKFNYGYSLVDLDNKMSYIVVKDRNVDDITTKNLYKAMSHLRVWHIFCDIRKFNIDINPPFNNYFIKNFNCINKTFIDWTHDIYVTKYK